MVGINVSAWLLTLLVNEGEMLSRVCQFKAVNSLAACEDCT